LPARQKIRKRALRRSWKSARLNSRESKNCQGLRGTKIHHGRHSVTGKITEKQIREKAIAGKLNAAGSRFGIIVSRFNEFITERLLRSAYDGLLRSGAGDNDITIVRVPGSFEIPSAARTLAETGKYDAIICLGCLLRGDTAHYDVVVNEVTRGIGQSAQETGIPHAFGVLTCETLEQAIDRAGLKMGNKGFEAALSAVEMANLRKAVSTQHSALSKTQRRRRHPVKKRDR
jgi:6,7-dimethyl-8-ribityllumazine synthase